MAFFLLGKTPDDSLRLLSARPSATRKEALAELSRLTSDTDFGNWDDEVFVVDLDEATPVLLVRPSGAPEAPQTEAAESVEALNAESETSTEDTAQAEDETDIEKDAEIVAVLEGLDESVLSEDAGVSEAPEIELADEETTPVSLKDALTRTAAAMEAEGVIVPPSVGAEAENEPVLFETLMAEEGTGEALSEMDEDSVVTAGTSEVEPRPAEESAGWPWAREQESERTLAIDALEEPGIDEGSLVRAAGDDDTMSFARPVILGAYEEARVDSEEFPSEPRVELAPTDEPPTEQTPQDESVAQPETEADEPHARTETDVPEAQPDAEQAESDATQLQPETTKSQPESDFILDLEEIVGESRDQAADTPGYSAAQSESESMSCDDCVYVQTCPNKDQRDPASCGSFQWK